MEVMTYIAQSISDAFGADDCSAYVMHDMMDFGVLQILWDVIGGSVRWKPWLDTASRVVLGCPPVDELTDTRTNEDYIIKSDFMDAQLLVSSAVAVQHGNLAIVAPWLDISQPLRIEGCFGVKIIQGRLGIVTNDGSQFQSLQGDSAVIETQHSEDVQSYVDKFPLAAAELGSHVALQRDESAANSDFILVPTGSNCYKLLMRVISDTHSRLLDPARAMIKTAQPVMTVSCTHTIHQGAQIHAESPLLKLYTYGELLGRWPDAQKGNVGDFINAPRRSGPTAAAMESDDNNEDESFPAGQYHRLANASDAMGNPGTMPTLHVSHVLDSWLKYNTALALVYEDVTILNLETMCLGCILQMAMDVAATNGIEGVEPNRWVVCRTKNPEARDYSNGGQDRRRDARKRIKASAM
jgi:hypothetical protein